MSLSYWVIEGVGLKVNDINKLNNEKLVRKISEELPDDECLLGMIRNNDYKDFCVDDYLFGYPFDNFGDILTHCDDTDTLTFGDDNEGDVYLYYPPSLPWWRREDEPQTLEEVIDNIVNAVQKVTDLSREEIKELIDEDLFVVGCG